MSDLTLKCITCLRARERSITEGSDISDMEPRARWLVEYIFLLWGSQPEAGETAASVLSLSTVTPGLEVLAELLLAAGVLPTPVGPRPIG